MSGISAAISPSAISAAIVAGMSLQRVKGKIESDMYPSSQIIVSISHNIFNGPESLQIKCFEVHVMGEMESAAAMRGFRST